FLFHHIKKLKCSKWKRPPRPKTLPIIRNLHNLKGLPHACFSNRSQTYGPLMLLRFGYVPVVVISSKEGAEEALNQPERVATIMISYNFKDIGFAPYGEESSGRELLACQETNGIGSEPRTQSPVNLKKTLFTLVAMGWLIDRVTGQNKTLNTVFSELDTTVSENPDVVDVMVDLMKKQDKDEDSFKLTTYHFKGIVSVSLLGLLTLAGLINLKL
ncbi:hypothetical protein HID58_043780, partial [Brassica napus]